MNERRIYYLAMAVSLTGLLALSLIPVEENDFFSVIKTCDYTDDITIRGKLINIADKGKLSILTIEDADYIPIVVFDRISRSYVNKSVKIKARLGEYKGSKELVASEVKIKN